MQPRHYTKRRGPQRQFCGFQPQACAGSVGSVCNLIPPLPACQLTIEASRAAAMNTRRVGVLGCHLSLLLLLAQAPAAQPFVQRPPDKHPALPRLDIDADGISTSGVSSGGAFAIQFHVAFSKQVMGAGLFAAPPYWCAQVTNAGAARVLRDSLTVIDTFPACLCR